jgi:PAT family beta-lactamase induction signal transducer AmpG
MKWVWGPFIDRFGYRPMGRRRPWILAAQLLMGLSLTAMLLIPDLTRSLGLLAMMVLLVNIFASLQDVSVDAMAIDLLPEKERGAANGFMFGSNYAASYLGGFLLGRCILSYGFRAAVAVQVCILLCMAAFPFFLRERPGDKLLPAISRPTSSADAVARPASLRQLLKLLLTAFSLRSTRLAGILAILSLVTVNGHLVYWPVHVQRDLNWTQASWLTLEGGYSVWFGLAGSVVGGLLASAIGTKQTVSLGLAALGACWFAYAFGEAYWTNTNYVTTLFLIESTLGGLLQVAMWALFMSVCWPPIAATQFTAYMALLNVSNGLGAKLAGPIEGFFGIINSHLALGVLQMALIIVVIAIDPGETRRKLGTGEAETLAFDANDVERPNSLSDV